MLVKLVIKSPNLRYDDIVFECNIHWTIKDVKAHIQENYPTKPGLDEQRLIYSGKLLSNSQVLGDVLRNLEDNETHMIHLVCKTSMSPVAGECHASNMAEVNNTDGLRQRLNVAQGSGALHRTLLPLRQDVAHPDLVTQQIMWWQQTYAQQYWAQYAQYMTTNALAQQHAQRATPAPTPVINAPVAAAVEEQGAAGVVLGPAEEVNEDNDGIRAARDWLDWTYMGTRLAILMSFIYFYSSLSRLLIIILIFAGVYLYQFAVKQRIIGTNPAEAGNYNANENQDQGNDADVPDVLAPQHQESRASAFSLALNLFTSFFASLIPEIPPPEVEVN